MDRYTKIILVGAALAAFLLPTSAQTAQTTAQTEPETAQQINQRKDNQQGRIGNGVGSGQLTAGEAANLENKESEVNQEEHDMRKLDDGHLTNADRATLQQQQNQLSQQIYQDKHNAAVQNAPPKGEVGERSDNQQDRIAQGVKSGQLTSSEAANLEHKEAGINGEIHNDRAANGGKLTPQERAKINHQQNKLSRQIYADKHNGRKQ